MYSGSKLHYYFKSHTHNETQALPKETRVENLQDVSRVEQNEPLL